MKSIKENYPPQQECTILIWRYCKIK